MLANNDRSAAVYSRYCEDGPSKRKRVRINSEIYDGIQFDEVRNYESGMTSTLVSRLITHV